MQDSRRGTTSGTNKVSGGRDTRRDDKKPDTGTTPGSAAFAAEVQSLRTELDERTQDLQRLTAEYANYRRRMDRDRALLAEQATGAVLAELL
ncbi:MAG: nucleotide exchange factor GrpE, partial [Micromonosporaceae bacterium]